MKDNVNKMLPDPQFEELGWQGWNYFKSAFEVIKKDYDKYGDVVLEKCLGESIDIYKDAFSSEKDFIGEILVIKGSNLYKFTLEETNGGRCYNHIIKMEKIKVIKLD